MEYLNKTSFAKIIGRSPSTVTKMINAGILSKCMNEDNTLIDVECGKKQAVYYQSRAKNKKENKVSKAISSSSTSSKKIEKEFNDDDNEKELKELLGTDPDMPLNIMIQVVDKFWIAKINKQKSQILDGNLVYIEDMKRVLNSVFAPINRYLNEQSSNLKVYYPELDNEITDRIKSDNDRIRLSARNEAEKLLNE